MKVYEEIKDIEFNIGDTLPQFDISVDVEDGTSLEDCTMNLVISSNTNVTTPIITKNCTVDSEDDTLFHVQLTTDETTKLTEGTYTMYFILIDTDDKEYKKIICSLYAHSAPRGTT